MELRKNAPHSNASLAAEGPFAEVQSQEGGGGGPQIKCPSFL